MWNSPPWSLDRTCRPAIIDNLEVNTYRFARLIGKSSHLLPENSMLEYTKYRQANRNISKYIQYIKKYTKIFKIPSGGGRRGRAERRGPAATWYFVYLGISFYILDIFGSVWSIFGILLVYLFVYVGILSWWWCIFVFFWYVVVLKYTCTSAAPRVMQIRSQLLLRQLLNSEQFTIGPWGNTWLAGVPAKFAHSTIPKSMCPYQFGKQLML